MVQTISQLHKLNALHRVFENCGILGGELSNYARAFTSGNLLPICQYGTQKDDDKEGQEDDNDVGPSPGAITNA